MEGVIWKDKSVSWKDGDGRVYTTGAFKTKKEAKEFLTKLGTTPIKEINIKEFAVHELISKVAHIYPI